MLRERTFIGLNIMFYQADFHMISKVLIVILHRRTKGTKTS